MKTYDVTNEDSVFQFGVLQGRALYADPTKQGDPDWPVCDAADNFNVGIPPDILADHELTNAYLTGVQLGLENAHDASPEGIQEYFELMEAAEAME